jgi:integrase
LCYQNEQISGEWSLQGRKLERSTANQRADEAKSFLCWAADRGLRGPFEVKEFFRSGPNTFGMPRAMRAGRAKENLTPKSIGYFALPTREEVGDWLRAVRRHRGYAKYLACRCIIEIGARRSEIEALEIHQWPTSGSIDRARRRGRTSVPIDLVETKGGRPRTVLVPLPYAQRVREWTDERRETYARRYSELHGNNPGLTQLFISDHPAAYGNPISAQTIYRCFVEIEPRPEGWSPHKGRHTFACFWVLHALELEASPHGGLAAMGADWIMHQGSFWLTKLKRQFGHMSERTTEIYLQCLATSCGVAALASNYHLDLDGDSDE